MEEALKLIHQLHRPLINVRRHRHHLNNPNKLLIYAFPSLRQVEITLQTAQTLRLRLVDQAVLVEESL